MTWLKGWVRADVGCRLLGAVAAVGVVLVWADCLSAQPSGKPTGQSIEAILAAKARRTPAQRKLSSQLLDAAESAQPLDGVTRRQTPTADVTDEVVTVDIRADVTKAVLARIRALGGTVINSVPKYRAIRARLPPGGLEPLAELDAVQWIRSADEPLLRTQRPPSTASVGRDAVRRAVTDKGDTSEGDVAHRANEARSTYGVDGTGIGVA